MCGGCLLRLATVDPEADSAAEAAPASVAGFEEWLKLKGQRIAGYELLDEIARGGMGIVYRARQSAAGRTVALKLMLPHLMHLPNMRQRFRHSHRLPIEHELGAHAPVDVHLVVAAPGVLDFDIARRK